MSDEYPTMKELRALTGLSQVKFAERFKIPRRTLEGWESKECCPVYIKVMLMEILHYSK